MNGPGRRYRRYRKLGPNARCLRCGTTDPTTLIQVKQRFFEEHHVLGQQHDPNLTVIVCRNCHAILSATQGDDGVPLEPQPTSLERLLAVVAALGSFLKVLAEALLEWATKGTRFVAGLDTEYPDWRNHPWAA
jgi:hypothetical protein